MTAVLGGKSNGIFLYQWAILSYIISSASSNLVCIWIFLFSWNLNLNLEVDAWHYTIYTNHWHHVSEIRLLIEVRRFIVNMVVSLGYDWFHLNT